MALSTNTISGFIPGQVPGYWNDNYPLLVQFLQAYYEYLEGLGPVNGIRNLINDTQIDTAPDDFLKIIAKTYLPYWPQDTALSLRKLLKAATQFYQTKGSESSIEFLFRVLYNLEAQVYYPSQQVMTLSGGSWQKPQSVKLNLSGNNATFNVALLQGRLATGQQSNATCVVETASQTVDPTINQEIVQLFLSQINGEFIAGEELLINCGTDVTGNTIVFEEKIIGSISDIVLNPNALGLGYVGTKLYANGTIQYQGDPVSIIGGLANANDTIMAVAYVGNVSLGSLTGVSVQNGGYGYQLDPNTIVTVTNAPGGSGSGAAAIVNGIDTTKQVTLSLNTDSLEFKKNQTLGAANYSFANTPTSNIHTRMANAFSFVAVNVAPLKSMTVTSQGSGYNQVPQISLKSIFKTDFAANLFAVYEVAPTPTNFQNFINAVGLVGDPGTIAAVQVLGGGSGYSNSTDTIVVDSAYGYSAVFDFVTNGDGAITQVIVTNGGYGYSTPKPPLLIESTAGSGAVLAAFGFGEGATLSESVSQIGQIQSIRLVNDGFDYVSTPLVSLRNEDLKIAPISNSDFYFQTDRVYQGANINSASFIAYVDQYDRSNSVLRLYNYTGSVNTAAPLVGNNVTTTVTAVTAYGNGKALAKADFFGGLIDYPGFWLGTSGQLSTDQKFQDAGAYQNYSYLIKVEKALSDYQKTIQKIAHPAGMRMGAICTITQDFKQSAKYDNLPVELSNTSLNPGNVTINAFGNGTVTGRSTTFVGNVAPGDLIFISRGFLEVTKEIKTVVNNTTLVLESNTKLFSPDSLNVNSGSNVVFTTGDTTFLAANDIIKTNINGNVQTSIVITADEAGGNFTVNTVFGNTATLVSYQVWPAIVNATYLIMEA